MTAVSTFASIGIDSGKDVFHLDGFDGYGALVMRHRLIGGDEEPGSGWRVQSI